MLLFSLQRHDTPATPLLMPQLRHVIFRADMLDATYAAMLPRATYVATDAMVRFISLLVQRGAAKTRATICH